MCASICIKSALIGIPKNTTVGRAAGIPRYFSDCIPLKDAKGAALMRHGPVMGRGDGAVSP